MPEGEDLIQPEIVGRICDRLCDCRMMSSMHKGSLMRLGDSYSTTGISKKYRETDYQYIESLYNSIAYGFEYIYRSYLESVIPIIAYKDGIESMGTCFRLMNGLITAKHCLTDGDQLSIRGYPAELLNKCPVYISTNSDIDLAYIDTSEPNRHNYSEPHVLDDVLVMGYPKIPFFLDFCTGEKANISSIAELRMTPTFGSIAAEGEIYFPKGLPKLLLITAKIRGGNSGGPVINNHGQVVGVATGIPAGEGLSDDNVGYGMAYPINALLDMIRENNVRHFEFIDLEE